MIMTNFKLNLKGQFNNSQTAVNPDCQPTVNRQSRLMSVLCLLTFLTLGVGNAWAVDYYLDISSFTGWTPEQDGNFSLWDGSENIHSTNVATNLYKFTTSKTPATLYFKRKDSGSNEFSVERSTIYNVYKVTGWNAGSCANYNISTVTKTNYIYFDNSTTNWSNSNRYFVIGHDKPSAYSKIYSMEALANTKLWYLAQSSDNWSDATYYAVINPSSSWGASTNWGSSNLSSAAKYTSAYTGKYDMNSGSSYWLTPATASNGCSFTIGSSIPTYSATQGAKVRNTTNDSYSAVSGSSSFPATLKLQGTYIDGTSHKSARSTISASAANAGSAKLTYTAVKTGLITHSYESLSGDYKFEGWGTGSTPTTTNASYEYNISANTTFYAFFTRKWQVTFGKGGTSGTSTVAATAGGSAISSGTKVVGGTQIVVTATPATGYEIVGWYSNSGCTAAYTSGSGGVTISADKSTFTLAGSSLSAAKTIYAKFRAKTYTVNLSYSGQANYGSAPSGVKSSVTATYGEAMPTMGTAPKAANGYGFYGYYTEPDGNGTKYYNADGTSAKAWDLDANNTTLYAYFRQAAITGFTFSPASGTVAAGGSLTVTPTIDPTPEGTTTVCWRVLYSNGNPLEPENQPTFTPGSGATVSFPAPATSGTYKVEATLHLDDCEGTVLSTAVQNFQVAGEHTVTVQYKCGSETIKPSTTVTGKPLEWSEEITPPDIFGYTFLRWVAEDGVSITTNNGTTTVDSTTTSTIKIKANYNGRLLARYTQKRIIYFKNTLGWSNVYVNFLSNAYWDSKGSGNKGHANSNKQMTRIGETDVWYFDYGTASITPSKYIAFTSSPQTDSQNFWGANPGVNVVYPTRSIANGNIEDDKPNDNGFYAKTPMFVPLAGQTAKVLNIENSGKANYYNNGYWTKYTPGTGYILRIYNEAGNTLLKTIEFTSTDELMPMTVVSDLEASTTYKYELLREGDVYYGNDNTMDFTDHGQETPWEMTWKSGGHKAGLTTNAAGNYTFHLTYSKNASNQYRLRMSVDYPIKSGDYRVIYKDGEHTNWHPSAIIPQVNNGKDTVSFFIRPGNAYKQMKIQQSTVASNGTITWSAGTDITSELTSARCPKDSVYNICLTMDGSGAISVENVEAYTGYFYIRTDAAPNKWDNYKNSDHMMTYSEYSEKNSDYTHYYVKHVNGGTNVKFVVANDYSPCISDTLIQQTHRGGDASHVDANGFLTSGDDGEANVRFMWHRHTNAVYRAYLAPAKLPGSKFLVLRGEAGKLLSESGTALTGESYENQGNNRGAGANCIQFVDDENWIYETMVKVKPSSWVKLYAKYHGSDFYYKGNNSNTFDGTKDGDGVPNAIQLITGDEDGDPQLVRVIYDFKTDRLIAALLPSGNITTEEPIHADVMFIREHQNDIKQLTFTESGSITEIKTAYGVMRFNKWTLNNKQTTGTHQPLAAPLSPYERSLFFISFPFRVKLNEVFGFGTYGTHWIIQYYDGAARAANGMWAETGTYWKYVWDRRDFVLEPNQGYLLALDLDLLGVDAEVWGVAENERAELFFPSYGAMPNITSAAVNVSLPEHTCTINRAVDAGGNPTGLPGGNDVRTTYDRRIVDSHWNVMGVPTYANTSDVSFTNNDSWITVGDGKRGPKFLYTWNADDNTLTATAGSGYTYKAMHAYMVQYHGDISWSASSGSPYPSSIVARRIYAEQPRNIEFCLEIQQNEKMIDRTYVDLSDDEETSTGFKFDEDMTKDFSGENKTRIYSIIEGDVVAAGNTLPIEREQTTVVPVGVTIKNAGEYTFAMPDGTNGVGVTLVDTEANVRTSLGALDYTVSLEAGEYTGRFVLEISPIQNTPTDIEAVSVQPSEVRKVMIDGILYIVKDGKMYDARGARVE